MPAYFVAELEVTNPAGMEPYRAAVPATIAQYGGRYLTRGGSAELIRRWTGAETDRRLEFADTAAVKRWPEFARIPENTADPAPPPSTAAPSSSKA